jgi:hypothetical protein
LWAERREIFSSVVSWAHNDLRSSSEGPERLSLGSIAMLSKGENDTSNEETNGGIDYSEDVIENGLHEQLLSLY